MSNLEAQKLSEEKNHIGDKQRLISEMIFDVKKTEI